MKMSWHVNPGFVGAQLLLPLGPMTWEEAEVARTWEESWQTSPRQFCRESQSTPPYSASVPQGSTPLEARRHSNVYLQVRHWGGEQWREVESSFENENRSCATNLDMTASELGLYPLDLFILHHH